MRISRLGFPGLLLLLVFSQVFFCPGHLWAHEGWGIVVDRQGQIYFGDIPTNTIWKITPAGKLEAALRNKHSHALVLGEDGSVYGTQEDHATAGRSVWRLAPEGDVSNVFTPAPDFLLNLHPFILDRAGNIYSTNSISLPEQRGQTMLLKSTPAGEVTLVAGGASGYRDGHGADAQFSGLDGMAWATDGSLYVTDGVYIRRVALDGRVSTLGPGALTRQSFGEDLMGLAVSRNGSVYVADYSQRRLLQLLAGGKARTVLETGWFWSPTGVTEAGEDLYVLEHLRMPLVILGDIGLGPYARVRKFSADGAVATIATVWGKNTGTFVLAVLAGGASLFFVFRFRQRNMRHRKTPAT